MQELPHGTVSIATNNADHCIWMLGLQLVLVLVSKRATPLAFSALSHVTMLELKMLQELQPS